MPCRELAALQAMMFADGRPRVSARLQLLLLHPSDRSSVSRNAFLEVASPLKLQSSFKRLTAEERDELEEMKTSRFEREEEHHKADGTGDGGAGDNGAVLPLPGFLTAVPGVSNVASSSYVLSVYEYAKENPMMTAWTVGTAAFSAAASAFRSVYDYLYPPEDAGWLGGWDAGLLSGGAVAGGWFSSTAATSSSSWFGGGVGAQADAADASGSGGWFGFGGSATSAAAGGAAAGGAAAGGAAAAGGWFGGLFGGGIGFCCILSQARLDGRFAGDWWPFVSLASAAGSSGEDKGQAQPDGIEQEIAVSSSSRAKTVPHDPIPGQVPVFATKDSRNMNMQSKCQRITRPRELDILLAFLPSSIPTRISANYSEELVLVGGCCKQVLVFVLLLSESLVLFIVTLSVSGFLFASMKFCLRPWAWLGMDSHLPILFDLQTSGLEVGTWDYCFLRRKSWPATTLRDVRVYKETLDSLGETGESEPVPISSSEKVSAELPQCCDATKACFGSCWRSCCSSGSGSFLVSGVFLGAKVESKVVRLTRDVWTRKEVERLLTLAQQGRQLLGLPEAPVEPESASDQVQIVDVECIPVSCVMGKEDGLPTIREDTILRDATEPSVLPMFSKEASEVAADERCMPTVRSGVLAPRPKMKSQSQAKVQDLLAV
ncbi:unnamed protein product [Symbiodinium natans]|uniref:Transmembrane protein n=1 Tax=Symbiodinium natans TaxID=878477 RepID=A0A812LDV4_9DINO|nr:unnamed protein product [Symbiodinium natans]